jgi:hypothetical protein
MRLPTCEFVRKTQNPAARDTQPVGNPILLLFLPLRLCCPPFVKDGFRSRIVGAFKGLQDMEVRLIYRAVLVIIYERGHAFWIAKRVERERRFYPQRKPLVANRLPQDRDSAGIAGYGELSYESDRVGLPQRFAAL